ncbi:antibiotic biosynthesis monooxygenase family protein [Phenylobacterium sp.]|jgi:quinol monooxygenase YgiN|uniref:antibiotic biosynthesis monooxygenase family protein n=1 Tax=Phenylobacterium sp. TaxID=1871053 RepID=UPI002F3E2751
MSLTLVNLFSVPPEEADAFVERFKATAEKLQAIAGFEGTELHRNTGVGDPTYPFVNIATWASADAWRAALPQIIAAAAGGLGGVVPKSGAIDCVPPHKVTKVDLQLGVRCVPLHVPGSEKKA